MNQKLKEAFLAIKDCLFPQTCFGCNQEGTWWCAPCQTKTQPEWLKWSSLKPDTTLDRLTALYSYNTKPIPELVWAFKYNYIKSIGALFIDQITREPCPQGYSVVPVPLHARRERERGFNQSALIAEALAKKYSLAYLPGLTRTRYTKQQAKLSKAERHQNIEHAFAWTKGKPPAHILLVDDVFTTGSTMEECAATLKAAGAERVEGFVLAKD